MAYSPSGGVVRYRPLLRVHFGSLLSSAPSWRRRERRDEGASRKVLQTRYAAATVLFIVPVVIVEFLTGNMTSAVFRTPHDLVINILHYGSGAILTRELARRWHKGFGSILILGAVYGMFNEGLGTGGFFDPKFYAVVGGGLENYGRWGGVNVVWALHITAFHAVFSIAIPIIIVDALFPVFTQRRLLSDKSLMAFFVILVAVTALTRFILSDTQPPINRYALAFVLILMVLLTLLARIFPSFDSIAIHRMPRDVILIVFGFITTFAWIAVIPTILTYIHLPIVNVLTWFCVLFLISRVLLGFAEVSNRQRLALAVGAEGLLLAHAVVSAIFVPALFTVALLSAAWCSSGSKIGKGALGDVEAVST